VQARGVSGTRLEILGVQNVKFTVRSQVGTVTLIHSFVVCQLQIDSAGILGLNFLQKVGAEISLTDNLLTIHAQHFPLSSAGLSALASQYSIAPQNPPHGLITRGAERALDLADGWEDYGSCIGTVELAVAVSVPPLSGRIARGRVVRRGDSSEFKAPPNCELMVEPVLRQPPGIYLARIVATVSCDVNKEISPRAHGKGRWSEVPLGSKDAGKLNYPCVKIENNNCGEVMTPQSKAGSGERQPESPKSSMAKIVADSSLNVRNRGMNSELQSATSCVPVENRFGNRTDTSRQIDRHKGNKIKHTGETNKICIRETGGHILGYVPIQIMNLSLEEITLSKHMCVGVASPTEICAGGELEIHS
jgi:hypothetical protein